MSAETAWIQARKTALTHAGIAFTEDATAAELSDLCKTHGIKVRLGDTPDEAKAKGPSADEIAVLKEKLEKAEKERDALIAKGFAAPATDGGAAALVFAQMAEAFKKQLIPEKDSQGFVNSAYVDPSDRLDKPVVLFARRNSHRISFTMRRGVPEKPPMGTIVFTPATGERRISGNETVAHYTCKTEITSRKQLEWAKSHETYGIDFHESASILNASGDNDWAAVASRWSMTLASKTPGELLRMASESGMAVNINEDPDRLRMRLVSKLAENEMMAIADFQRKVAVRGTKDIHVEAVA